MLKYEYCSGPRSVCDWVDKHGSNIHVLAITHDGMHDEYTIFYYDLTDSKLYNGAHAEHPDSKFFVRHVAGQVPYLS